MKSGVSLQQMLTEVKRQSESKEDYLIAPNRLRMESYGKEMFLHLSDDSGTELIEPMTITGIAHRQIGTHLRIPAAYYDRMREERPDLLAYNANTWFKQENSQRMLRTLDGSARAYLSNRYRRIDNIDIAGVTLPILGGLPDIRFESCQITESRMYIKAVNPRLQAEVSPGDIVQAGVIISNSEVGLGSVSIQPLIYRLVCSNGMVVNEAAARRNHVGRVTDSEENFSVYSQATLDAEDKAFVMKIQDTVRAAVEEARFSQIVGKMQEAKAAQMDTHDVPAVVKLASKEFHITDSESTGVLQRLIESNDLTLYGLCHRSFLSFLYSHHFFFDGNTGAALHAGAQYHHPEPNGDRNHSVGGGQPVLSARRAAGGGGFCLGGGGCTGRRQNSGPPQGGCGTEAAEPSGRTCAETDGICPAYQTGGGGQL